MRADRQPIHFRHVEVLIQYFVTVNQTIIEAKEKNSKQAKKIDMHALVKQMISRAGFRNYFKDMKEDQSKINPEMWEEVECPV